MLHACTLHNYFFPVILVYFVLFCCSLDPCGELGAFGGNGGEVFDDPCDPALYITKLELAIGPLGNCSKCLRYIRATYR